MYEVLFRKQLTYNTHSAYLLQFIAKLYTNLESYIKTRLNFRDQNSNNVDFMLNVIN